MKRRIFCLILIILQLPMYFVSAAEYSLDTELNPEFVEYTEIASFESSESEYIPSLISVVSPADLGETDTLPEKYDARVDSRIFESGVGQYTDNTCWTFASCLASETAIKDKFGEFTNLSEQHLKYASSYENDNPYGYNKTVNSGGNFKMFEAYASSWRGLVKEEDDPYVYGGAARDYETVTAKKPVSFHVSDTIVIPNVAKTVSEVTPEQRLAHINEVKKYIMQYGCSFGSMYWNSSYNNYTTHAYFNKSDTSISNHAISIIGWDDNYSKSNFKETPENDGAFIIKNSQSETGYYMYMSYEDLYAGWDAACITGINTSDDYGINYNYNYFEPGAQFTLEPGTSKTTVNFKSNYDGEILKAVGAYTVSRNLGYSIYIGKGTSGNESNEAKYTLVASGTFEMPGLHTVELASPYALGKGGTGYSVRIIYSSSERYGVPIERNINGGVSVSNVKTEAGRCFINTSDTIDYDANLYVKAFTDADYEITVPFADEAMFEKAKYSVGGGEYRSLDKVFHAGLNDEISFDFSQVSSELGVFSYGGNTYSVTDKKLSLKATASGEVQYLGNTAITVSFDADGGSGAPSAMTVKNGAEFTLPEQIPVKSGFLFGGWTLDEAVYVPGQKVAFSGSVTLKAVWNAMSAGKLKMSLKAYSDGTEVETLYAGNIYDISFCASEMTASTFFGGTFELDIDESKACFADENGYMAENVLNCVHSLVSDKLEIDAEKSSVNISEGTIKVVIKPKAAYESTGVLIGGESADLFKLRLFIMNKGDIVLDNFVSELYLGSDTDAADVTIVPFSASLKFESISGVSYQKAGTDIEICGDVEFGRNKKIICAAYKGNKLVGVKVISCTPQTESFLAEFSCSAEPDKGKVFIWEDFLSLTTGFLPLEF